MKRRILLIDEDLKRSKLIYNCLLQSGYDVNRQFSFIRGLSELYSCAPDLVIIGTNNAAEQGIKAIKSIREWCTLPLIAIGRQGEKHTVLCLDAGADVYLGSPFSTAELLAYIRVNLARLKQAEALLGAADIKTYRAGALRVNLESYEVLLNKREIHLTKNEFRILALLCKYSGKVLSYDFIMKSVWGPQGENGNGILRVNVTNIRKKIEPDAISPKYIFTENGVGYRIIPNEE